MVVAELLPDLSSTRVLFAERRVFGVGRVLVFDIQGWLALLLGGLLALITLFSSYSHVHIPFLGAVALDQQIGVLLLSALVPELFGDAELATRCRLRPERDRVQAERDRVREAEDRARAADEAAEERNRAAEERILASEERDRADQERERAARSEQRQARALRAGALVWLNPTPLNRRFLELVAAELAESVQP